MMSELQLKSSLTIGEIEDNFKDIDFFSEIMYGLQEVLEYTKKKRLNFSDGKLG